MLLIYKIKKVDKAKIKAMLEENPYEEGSFSKIGYVLREGEVLGLDKDALYLKLEPPEEYVNNIKEKLNDIAVLLEGEEFNKAKEAFEKEESSSLEGFGSLFG